MSLTSRCPDAKAMEFGGVDTGSMKAYEHPTVAGIMKYRGFTAIRIACREQDQESFGQHSNCHNCQNDGVCYQHVLVQIKQAN